MSALLNPLAPSTARGRGSHLRALPKGARQIGNVGFIALVLAIVGVAMFGLVALSAQTQQVQFEVSAATREDQSLGDRAELLQAQYARISSVAELAKRAEMMGMVPAGNVGYLNPDGSATGKPKVVGNSDFPYLRTAAQIEADNKAKAEEAAKKKAAEEAAAKKAEEEAAAKKKAEEEAAKKSAPSAGLSPAATKPGQ